MTTGRWAMVRTDWGRGQTFLPDSTLHRWTFLLLEEIALDEIDDAYKNAGGRRNEGEDVHLIGVRFVATDEEDLFLPFGRSFVYITGFMGMNDYAKAFTEAVAAENFPVHWNGEWSGHNVISRADLIMRAKEKS